MAHKLTEQLLRSALTSSQASMASSTISSKILRKALAVTPGQYSTFSSMSRLAEAGIPHPSTFPVKPMGEARTFDEPSRPRATYSRPKFKTRELPVIKRQWPMFLAAGVTALSLWAGFLIYTANQERLSSSIVRQFIMRTKRSRTPELLEALGDDITLVPEWWALNQPWVNGQINMPKGQIDVSLKIKGSKGAGTVYFTSVRREKGSQFTILRYKVITDDGRTIHLDPTEELGSMGQAR